MPNDPLSFWISIWTFDVKLNCNNIFQASSGNTLRIRNCIECGVNMTEVILSEDKLSREGDSDEHCLVFLVREKGSCNPNSA